MRRHELRVHNEGEFLRIGRQIASYISGVEAAPRSLEELKLSGVLQEQDWTFLVDHKATYLPPASGARQQQHSPRDDQRTRGTAHRTAEWPYDQRTYCAASGK